jgi:predicted RNA-binding protein with PUA-like domain
MSKQYWLFKTEPVAYSIDDLRRDQQTEWSGIRNYQVRNLIRDTMRVGDMVFIYHSSAKEIGIVGVAKVVSDKYADTEQFLPSSHYFDPKSGRDNPRWYARDVQFVKKFSSIILLDQIKKEKPLQKMRILEKGNRLSISELTDQEFAHILSLAKEK